MPKTKTEARTEKKFEKEYGGDKGKQVYFALRNKNKKFDRSQGGGMSSGKKKKAKSKSEWWADRLSKLPESKKAEILLILKSDTLEWLLQRLKPRKKNIV